MHADVARSIAHARHHDQHDRHGAPLIEHLDRVAAHVSPEARAVAYLHDALEWTDVSYAELRESGLGDDEAGALELLTRGAGESYELYVLRIAHAEGRAGTFARAVKVADLEDHLEAAGEGYVPREPPYLWARRHIAIAQERRKERPSHAVAYRAPERRDGGGRGWLPPSSAATG